MIPAQRDDYATLPGRQRTNLDYYSVFFVAPSVVPTYLPSVRVWTYNTTLPRDGRPAALIQRDIPLESSESLLEAMEEDAETELGEEEEEDAGQPLHPTKRSHRRRHRKRKHHKKKKLPRYASPDSPSRRNTYLSMLGYSQWILDIDAANTEYEKVRRKQGKKEAEKLELEYKLEYTTYEPRTLWTEFLDDDKDEDESAQDVEERHVPVPKKLLRNELERLGTKPPSYALVRHVDVKDASSQLNDSTAAVADTDTDASKHHRHNGKRFKKEGTKNRKRKKGKKGKGKLHVPRELKHFTDYALPHVTLEPMLELARHLALDAKLWKRYVRRIYSSSGATA